MLSGTSYLSTPAASRSTTDIVQTEQSFYNNMSGATITPMSAASAIETTPNGSDIAVKSGSGSGSSSDYPSPSPSVSEAASTDSTSFCRRPTVYYSASEEEEEPDEGEEVEEQAPEQEQEQGQGQRQGQGQEEAEELNWDNSMDVPPPRARRGTVFPKGTAHADVVDEVEDIEGDVVGAVDQGGPTISQEVHARNYGNDSSILSIPSLDASSNSNNVTATTTTTPAIAVNGPTLSATPVGNDNVDTFYSPSRTPLDSGSSSTSTPMFTPSPAHAVQSQPFSPNTGVGVGGDNTLHSILQHDQNQSDAIYRSSNSNSNSVSRSQSASNSRSSTPGRKTSKASVSFATNVAEIMEPSGGGGGGGSGSGTVATTVTTNTSATKSTHARASLLSDSDADFDQMDAVMSFNDNPMPVVAAAAAADSSRNLSPPRQLVKKLSDAEIIADSHVKNANMLGELSTVLTKRNSLKESDMKDIDMGDGDDSNSLAASPGAKMPTRVAAGAVLEQRDPAAASAATAQPIGAGHDTSIIYASNINDSAIGSAYDSNLGVTSFTVDNNNSTLNNSTAANTSTVTNDKMQSIK